MAVKRREYRSVARMVEGISDDQDFVNTVKERLSKRRIVKTLVALRTARGLSQADIARELRCTQSRISKLENGSDDELRAGDVRDYAEALGLELQLALFPKDLKATDKVKLHAFAIRKLLDDMVQHAHVDQGIAQAVAGFFGETFFNLLKIVKDSSERLPQSEEGENYIEIVVYQSESLEGSCLSKTRAKDAIDCADRNRAVADQIEAESAPREVVLNS